MGVDAGLRLIWHLKMLCRHETRAMFKPTRKDAAHKQEESSINKKSLRLSGYQGQVSTYKLRRKRSQPNLEKSGARMSSVRVLAEDKFSRRGFVRAF